MADRTVKVSLIAATSNYVTGMKQAEEATSKTSTAAQKLANQREAMQKVGTTLLVAGGLIAAGLISAVKAAADFDAQMAQLQTLSHATAAQMDQLRNAALTMGTAIGFSATEVADAEIELTKAGVSVKDQLGGALTGALNLAAAGQLNVADATQIAASAMTQFKLQGKDVPHIADLLAAGADKALGSVSDLGNALKFVGPVANGLGVSIEQTTGTLALFAQNGIIGEQAGTELRGVLLSLVAPSRQASDVMKTYGINLYDAQGKFVGVDGAAQQLKKGLGPLDEATRNAALGQIFGNAQVTAAQILYSGGAKAVDQWTNAVNDSGFAQEQARGKLNSLNGDLSKLKSAFQSGLIETGQSAEGSLRGLVQGVTSLIEAYNNMSDTGKSAVFIIGSVAAGATLMGGAFLTIVPKIAAAKAALAALNTGGVSLGKTLGVGGAIALGLTVVTAGLAGMASKASLASDQIAQLDSSLKLGNTKSLDSQFTGGGGFFDTIGTKATGIKGALDALNGSSNKLSISLGKFIDGADFGLSHVSDTAKRFQAQFAEIGTQLGTLANTDLPSATQSFSKLVTAAGGGSKAASELLALMPDYKAELITLAGASDLTLSKQDLLNLAQGKGAAAAKLLADASSGAGTAAGQTGTALDSLGQSASATSQNVDDLATALSDFTSPTLDARAAARDYRAAIDAVTQSIKDNGTTLDINTDKGRANQAALDGIASSAEKYAGAVYKQTGSQDQANKILEDGRNQLIAAAAQYGITGDAANALADQIIGTPTQWATLFTAETSQATKDTDGYQQKVAQTPAQKTTKLAADISDATTKLSNLQGQYGSVPPNKATKFLADVADATANLNQLKAKLDAIQSKTVTVTTNLATTGGTKVAFASGGAVHGPGTSTSDSITARLSAGEHVLTARDVRNLGGQGAVYALRAAASRSAMRGGYAEGGQVQYAAPVQQVSVASGGQQIATQPRTYNLYSLDPEPFAQAVIRRENLGFV